MLADRRRRQLILAIAEATQLAYIDT